MTPYGYHNSEITHINGDERRNAREAIRQAKLVQQQAREQEAGSALQGNEARAGAWHRWLARVQRSAPRAYLRNLRAHS